MDWENVPENIEDWLGFIYLVERVNAPLGEARYYIGKKMFWSNVKLKPLKGKTRNRRVRKESDWRKYYGSSNDLKEALALHGPENFKRTIIHLCESKWTMSYMETLEQMRRGVLFDGNYLNGIVHLRINKCPVALRGKYRAITLDIFKSLEEPGADA